MFLVNQIEIYENDIFGNIRTTLIDGEPYFVGKDIALALGYKDPKNTVKNRCKRGRGCLIPHPQNPSKELDIIVIPESDVYRLIIGSKLESAQKFESWIMEDVLPTIRRHGAYMTNEVLERALTSPDFLIQLATQLKHEKELREKAEQRLSEQEPLVNFANKVSASSNLIDMGKLAKLLHDEHIPIGRNKLFEWLRNNKILMSNNIPYQKYVNGGYFQIKESVYDTPYGVKTQQTTYVTGKGQIFITEKLRSEFTL